MKVFISLFFMFFTTQLFSYNTLKYNGYEIHWKKFPVKYYIDPAGSPDVPFEQLKNAIINAFKTWQNVSCATITFQFAGTQSFGSYSNWNGVYLRFDNSAYTPQEVVDAAAYTMSWKYNDGEIYMSEIVFNDKNLQWTTTEATTFFSTKIDIQGVATHEIGHAFGLDHSKIRKATMFFSGGSAELRTLDQDDINGICYLYPKTAFTKGNVCDACSSDSNCQNGICLQYDDYGVLNFCGQNCNSDSDCPENYFCYKENNINQCVPTNYHCDQAGGNVDLGGYCWGNEVCQSGVCIPLPDTAFCSKKCNPSYPNSCPSGFKCMGEGSEGYCVKEGNTPYGGSCSTHIECQTGLCAQLCYGGSAVCTAECGAGKPPCPNNDPCSDGICIPKGTKKFGEECSCSTDCETGYCTAVIGTGYCSYKCDPNGQNTCPDKSYCKDTGYCSKPGGGLGDKCKSDLNCESNMFCKFANQYKEEGTCEYKCDPISDSGCPQGMVCVWYNMYWLDKIVGECVNDNGGKGVGEACDPQTMPCKPNYICANVGGTGLKCYKDCKTTSAYGCNYDEKCVSMGIPNDEVHGLCIKKDNGGGNNNSTDTTTPPQDTKDTATYPDNGGSNVGSDSGTPNTYDAQNPQPGIDTTQSGNTDESLGMQEEGSSSSSGFGCSYSQNKGSSPYGLAVVVLLVVVFMMVRRKSVFRA